MLRLSALPALVLLPAVSLLPLTACGSLVPASELLNKSSVPAEVKPAGLLTIRASVALGPITGPSRTVSGHLVRLLDAASRRADLALLYYAGAQGDYQLKGEFKTFQQKNKVKVVYSWQVLDKAGGVLGSASGIKIVPAVRQDPWDSIPEPALEVIAGQGIALVERVAKGEPALTTGSAAPDALTKVNSSGLAETAAKAPDSTAAPLLPQDKAVTDALEALRLVNDFRKLRGLQPLALDSGLITAAAALANDMAKHDRLSHSGPDGADLDKRLRAAGYAYAVAAENVGAGQGSVAELIGEWKKDREEGDNLLLPDTKHMGIAGQYRADTNLKTFWALVVASSS